MATIFYHLSLRLQKLIQHGHTFVIFFIRKVRKKIFFFDSRKLMSWLIFENIDHIDDMVTKLLCLDKIDNYEDNCKPKLLVAV